MPDRIRFLYYLELLTRVFFLKLYCRKNMRKNGKTATDCATLLCGVAKTFFFTKNPPSHGAAARGSSAIGFRVHLEVALALSLRLSGRAFGSSQGEQRAQARDIEREQ